MAAQSKKVSDASRETRETGGVRSKKAARGGILATIREWADAIVVAFLLAMFIRLFVVELFKIPSPSMTPTLLGTQPPHQEIAYHDVNEDDREDMILRSGGFFHVYLDQGAYYQFAGTVDPGSRRSAWLQGSRQAQDRILVGKFLYWFQAPERGDIVVFKVPESIFEPSKPIYIKRVVGLPGEELGFAEVAGVPGHRDTMGRLAIDGAVVEAPSFFQHQRYEYRNIGGLHNESPPDYNVYRDLGMRTDFLGAAIPEDMVFVFGDNTVSSRDSRYWGGVPLQRLRGKAVFRYNRDIGFLH